MNPIVSVILSVNSNEKLLDQTFSSILSQSLKNLEFIVIIDGSDPSVEIIARKYIDPRLIVVNRPWEGLTKSLNYGIEISRGKYIARSDAGDYSFPNRLSKQVFFLENNKSVGLLGTCYLEETIKGDNATEVIFPTQSSVLKDTLIYQNQFCHGTVMFKKQCIKDVGKYRDEFVKAQDYDLWLRISDKYEISNLPDILYKRRIERKSISISNKYEQEMYAEIAIECALSRARGEMEPLYKLNNIIQNKQKNTFISERKANSQYYFNQGRRLYKERKFNQSRYLFLKSLYSWPLLLHRWIFLFATLLPTILVDIIEPQWKKFQRKFGIRI